MKTQEKLAATKREVFGRKVKQLRTEGKIPANIFGKELKSVSISVTVDDFKKVFNKAGETGIIDISLGKENRPVLVTGVQHHPVTDEILHVDFRQVDLKAKITAQVPVELIGVAPAEKEGLGIMVQQLNEVEVEALPLDLPDTFELDATVLKTLDDSIKVSDIKVGEKVTILTELEQTVANISAIRQEEEVVVEEEEDAAEGAKGEEGAEAKPEDSETTEKTDDKKEEA